MLARALSFSLLFRLDPYSYAFHHPVKQVVTSEQRTTQAELQAQADYTRQLEQDLRSSAPRNPSQV